MFPHTRRRGAAGALRARSRWISASAPAFCSPSLASFSTPVMKMMRPRDTGRKHFRANPQTSDTSATTPYKQGGLYCRGVTARWKEVGVQNGVSLCYSGRLSLRAGACIPASICQLCMHLYFILGSWITHNAHDEIRLVEKTNTLHSCRYTIYGGPYLLLQK